MLSSLRRIVPLASIFAVSLVVAPTSSLPTTRSAMAAPRGAGKKKPKKTPPPPPPAAVESPAPIPAPPSPPAAPPKQPKSAAKPDALAGQSTQSLIDKAKSLYDSLEYADVIPLAAAVLAREDITIDQRLDAYLLHGSALAIVGDAIEAEKPFRFLLRGRPEFEMPAETPPKILAVFRKVQVEEKAIVDQMKELARQRAIREIEVKSEVPTDAKGGEPLIFEYKLKDPRGAVATMDLHYRKAANEAFSSLALKVDDSGYWKAELPGESTENDDGFTLQYYLTTKDSSSTELVAMGGPSSPLTVQVAAGSVASTRPFYKSWWFWTATAGAVIAAGVSGWLVYDQATKLPETAGRIDLGE